MTHRRATSTTTTALFAATAVLAATAAVLLALTACGSSSGETDTTQADDATEVLDYGQTHSTDGLDISADITEVFTPDDYANFGNDNPYALITLTVTNTSGQDTDAISGPMHECQLDGTATTYEQFQGITENAPGLISAGDTVTWPAAACPVSTDGTTRGETVDYGITTGTETLWFTGSVPAQ